MIDSVPDWAVFPPEPATLDWLAAARPRAETALIGAARRHGRTWAPGVDLLDNDASGAVPKGPALAGAALTAAHRLFGPLPLHRAQISALWPGYPGRDPDTSDAAHAFRATRDAAHLDGLLPQGPARRRHLIEPHAWVLGIGLSPAPAADAAPLVAWRGSAAILRAALRAVLGPIPPADWPGIDLTEPYTTARRQVLAQCQRIPLPLAPGQAVLLNRHTLHGTAPWGDAAGSDPRMVAFFRPQLPQIADWL